MVVVLVFDIGGNGEMYDVLLCCLWVFVMKVNFGGFVFNEVEMCWIVRLWLVFLVFIL